MIHITNIKITSTPLYNELAGNCGDFNLWYRFPKHINPEARADTFVAAILLPAMLSKQDIVLAADIPISPQLLKNLDQLQDVFVLWGQLLNKYFQKISIRGGTPTPPTTDNQATVSFFSGGVDGTYTFLKHKSAIDYLLFSKGIDIQLTNAEDYDNAFRINADYLQQHDKQLHSIETNVRYLGHRYGLSWNICVGGGLASIALAGGFQKCLIASSNSYADLYADGSSFITDHLWSNEHTKIVNDGAEATRMEKIRQTTANLDYLNIIRVCWHDKGYNCGECEKCLRTMASLRALRRHAPTFPECSDAVVRRKIAKIKIYEATNLAYHDENLVVAIAADDQVLVNAIIKVKRVFFIRQMLRNIDELFLNNFFRKRKSLALRLSQPARA